MLWLLCASFSRHEISACVGTPIWAHTDMLKTMHIATVKSVQKIAARTLTDLTICLYTAGMAMWILRKGQTMCRHNTPFYLDSSIAIMRTTLWMLSKYVASFSRIMALTWLPRDCLENIRMTHGFCSLHSYHGIAHTERHILFVLCQPLSARPPVVHTWYNKVPK